MRHAKLALGILTAAVVLGCSPVCRLRVSFTLPKSAGAIDFAKLHVRGRVACQSYNLADPEPRGPVPPPAGPEEKEDEEVAPPAIADAASEASDASAAGDADADAGDPELTRRRPGRQDVRAVQFRREGDFFEISQRSTSCHAAATGWYDANANGIVDRGDFVAEMPTTLFKDLGLCVGNLTTVGPIELKPWAP